MPLPCAWGYVRCLAALNGSLAALLPGGTRRPRAPASRLRELAVWELRARLIECGGHLALLGAALPEVDHLCETVEQNDTVPAHTARQTSHKHSKARQYAARARSCKMGPLTAAWARLPAKLRAHCALRLSWQ